MKKAIALIICLALAVGILPGCMAAETRYPLQITDQAGREVCIQAAPETIVSGYYIATSLLIALDCEDRLTGIENDAAKRPIYALSAPQLLDLPAVGTMKLLDIETCASLNPDLLILPLGLKENAAVLEELGLTVLFVNPESSDLLDEAIEIVGSAVNRSDRAAELAAFIDETAAAIESAVENADRPSVYLAGNSAYLKTAGSGMYQHSLIERAGASNAAAAIPDDYWCEISYEQLLSWNPEYIFTASGCKYSTDELMQDDALKTLAAVENGRVYAIPGSIESWDSPVPASILGSMYAASVLHPDLCSPEDYSATVCEFYERFYGFTPEI